ncbi:MAG: hypothetical protein ACHQAX_01400 [Gammaproteobacteria bacterium]
MPRYETTRTDARPTYAQVEKWHKEKTKVILHQKEMVGGKLNEKQLAGTISRLSSTGFSEDDGLLWMSGHMFGMYIRDIASYTVEQIIFTAPESKIILSQTEAALYPADTKLLISGNYSVYVSKTLLAGYSEYFRALFEIGMNESFATQIDLSATITSHGLQQVLSLLDKIHNKENTRWLYLPLNDVLELIVNADLLCSQQLMDLALEELSSSMRTTEHQKQLKLMLENSPNEIHPLIKNQLENLKEWKKRYLDGFPSYVLNEYQIITKMPRELMHMTLDDYEFKMMRYASKLKLLTQAQWFFNGINLCSEHVYYHHPEDKKHRDIYAHVVTDILIARGIVSGKKCEYNDDNPNMRDRWSCHVIQETALFSLNENQLRREIEEASQLINEITGYTCHYLQIYGLPPGYNIEVMAKIGCIVVREYYAFNVNVIDYNIKLLRLLKSESISLKTLNERYQLSDQSRPLLDQIISPERQAFLLKGIEADMKNLTPLNWNPRKDLGVYFTSKSNGFLLQRKFDNQTKTWNEPSTFRLWSKAEDKARASDDCFTEVKHISKSRHHEI